MKEIEEINFDDLVFKDGLEIYLKIGSKRKDVMSPDFVLESEIQIEIFFQPLRK